MLRVPRRRDHALWQFTLKVPAVIGEADREQELLIIIIFEQIEQLMGLLPVQGRVELKDRVACLRRESEQIAG